ncbi:hypothetical protein CYQ88_04315 [Hydrogenovibrio sp. SC-1]|nr:hypothetical protein CYQ88_04315 [Hydrogenovibrio sp. SC-1]
MFMGNVRRYFRYDVEIPLFFETADEQEIDQRQTYEHLMTAKEAAYLQKLNRDIQILFGEAFPGASETLHIFQMLDHRIDFMAWLLKLLIRSEDPRKQPEYRFRVRSDMNTQLPKARKKTKIMPLIEGIYVQLDDHLHELIEVVQNSIAGKLFLYPRKMRPIFQAKDYVKNLQELADNGFAPAQVLSLLIEKLNAYEQLLIELKQAYLAKINNETWQVQRVNLSAGGFSFNTPNKFAFFAKMNVFMKLGDDILVCRGRVVLNKFLPSLSVYKVGVEFESISKQHARLITLYVQHQELRDAIAEAPTITLPSDKALLDTTEIHQDKNDDEDNDSEIFELEEI